jgi:hypothetical protein
MQSFPRKVPHVRETAAPFGYPVRPANPESQSAEEWISRANRRPFDEVVERR